MPNFALLSIPAYYVLALVPHTLSTAYLKKNATNVSRRLILPTAQPLTSPSQWDNANPRGSSFTTKLTTRLPPTTLAKYERLRAAHNNMMENMAFYIGAVLAGVTARSSPSFLNTALSLYLASRVVYLGIYYSVDTRKLSFLRSAVYIVGCVNLTVIYVRAALDWR